MLQLLVVVGRALALGLRGHRELVLENLASYLHGRLIGSIRRDCLNHVVVFGEQHLRRVLTGYCACCHGSRTYLPLAKARQRRDACRASPRVT